MAVAVTDPRYDTIQPRFVAGLIDGLLLLPFAFVDLLVFSQQIAWLSIVWITVSYPVYWLYSVVGHKLYGKTLGKHVMKVVVLDNESEVLISWKQAVLRDIFPIAVNSVVLVLHVYIIAGGITELPSGLRIVDQVLSYGAIAWFIAEIVTALMNDRRRALHDFIAGTVVVKTHQSN